ncbi:MAG: type II secretion system protein [Wujia sp.]
MKKNNKGFSLVELIIVIAIMAILAGAIAPALIRYIDKSRRSNDVSAAKTIDTAVSTALGNEKIYELLTTGGAIITITPSKACSSTESNDAIAISEYTTPSDWTDADVNNVITICKTELANSFSNKTPKISYKKDAKGDDSTKPDRYFVYVSTTGKISVLIGNSGTEASKIQTDAILDETCIYTILPECCDSYQ